VNDYENVFRKFGWINKTIVTTHSRSQTILTPLMSLQYSITGKRT